MTMMLSDEMSSLQDLYVYDMKKQMGLSSWHTVKSTWLEIVTCLLLLNAWIFGSDHVISFFSYLLSIHAGLCPKLICYAEASKIFRAIIVQLIYELYFESMTALMIEKVDSEWY